MEAIRTPEALLHLENGNRFLCNGTLTMKNSSITFQGADNILVCEGDVELNDSTIIFRGNNTVVYLNQGRKPYRLKVGIYGNSVCYFGKGNHINGVISASIGERKHFFVGNDNLFATGIWVRTSDPHLLYDVDSHKRINPSASVYLGDHVWVAQGVSLLKGSRLGSGTVVAANAVLSGKTTCSNTCWGGVPAKELKSNIFWDVRSVLAFSEQQAADYEYMQHDKHIFRADEKTIGFEEIEQELDCRKDPMDRVEYLRELTAIGDHNRFAVGNTAEK